MATLDQLFQAMGMFKQASQEYGVQKGIEDATLAVNELKQNSALDFNQRIAAQGQLANSLQAQLAGLGAPQAQIAAAVGAIQPPKIETAADAMKLANTSADPAERAMLLKEAQQRARLEGQMNLAQNRDLISFQTDEDIRKQRAKLSLEIGGSRELSPAEKRFDEKMSEQLAEWEPANFAKATDALTEVEETLRDDKTSTGLTGKLAAMVPGTKTSETANNVRSAIQDMLRPIYGSQFTEKEGDRFFRTLYDPGDRNEANLTRLNRFKETLKKQAENMQRASDTFQATGSFKGVKAGGYAEGVQLLNELAKKRKEVSTVKTKGKEQQQQQQRPAGVPADAVFGSHRTKDGRVVKGWKKGTTIWGE